MVNKRCPSEDATGFMEYDIVTPAYKCNIDRMIHGFPWFGTIGRYSGLLQRRKDIVDRYDRGFAGLASIHWHIRRKLLSQVVTSTSPM